MNVASFLVSLLTRKLKMIVCGIIYLPCLTYEILHHHVYLPDDKVSWYQNVSKIFFCVLNDCFEWNL